MSKQDNLMSPDASPNQLKKSGVRRVNNRPLLIVLSLFILFVLIIAFAAMKRASVVKKSREHAPTIQHTDSALMAAEVVAGHLSDKNRPQQPIVTIPQLVLPVALVENANNPPVIRNKPPILRPKNSQHEGLSTVDLDRIRMTKIQQFEDAVKAKIGVSLPSQLSATHKEWALSRGTNDIEARQATLKRQIKRSNSGDATGSFQAKLLRIQSAMAGQSTGEITLIQPSDSFQKGNRWALNSAVEAPKTPYVLRAGAVIPGTLITGIKSELPGQISGQVAQDVYDTATGKHLLIPQGTRLLGVYSNQVVYGQDALLIAWQRLTFPDAKALDIGSMPGTDSAGYSGFHDQVNNHYVRLFGSALLMSGVVAGITYSQNPAGGSVAQFGPPTAGSVLSAALGQELGQVTTQMFAKNLNIAPSLKIRPGYEFNIMVVKDMTFNKPYQSFDY